MGNAVLLAFLAQALWAADISSYTVTRTLTGPDQVIVAELRQRRLLSPEATRWEAEDMNLLLRLRKAEDAGALALLKRNLASLKGLAVAYKAPGSSAQRLRLTKEGYERYLFYKSQEAVQYFESRDIEAKWIFLLKDLDGRPLFNDQGLLTPEGDSLVIRALAGKPVQWKNSAGEIMSSRPIRARP